MAEKETPDESRMGDEVYQPDRTDEVTDDAALMDPEDTLDDRGVDPAIDEGYSPPERPLGVEHLGVTAAEQHAGETLDQRLAEEEPEARRQDGDGIGDAPRDGEPIDPQAGDERSGRLEETDDAGDLAAEDRGIAGGAASAEEAAMHTVADSEE